VSGCILVLGMPRSGTTWIGKLFDSHPDTLYRHEPDSVSRLSLPLYPAKESAPDYVAELQQFLANLPGMRHPKVVGKQPLFPKTYLSSQALAAYRASVALAKAAGRTKGNFPCVYRPTASRCGRTRLVWKSIESSGRLGVMVDAFPEASFIHVIRHPAGCVASRLRGEAAGRFDDAKPSADDLWRFKVLLATPTGKRHGLTLADVERLSPEERLAWRWVLGHEKIFADIKGCKRVLTVRYEDVCANPVGLTHQMFAFTGLGWSPQTEAFVHASTETTGRPADTDYYSVFKPPRASADRWRSELGPDVIDRILAIFRRTDLSKLYAEDVPAAPQPEAAT
jgi:hypothetical protein